jgi:S-adenosylmethionine uptake transporter
MDGMRAGPVLLYVIGIAVFCAMDAFMKQLVQGNPAVMATFWRYARAILFTSLFWVQAGRPAITREMLPVHMLRGCILAVSATLFFWSLSVLPLAQAVISGAPAEQTDH